MALIEERPPLDRRAISKTGSRSLRNALHRQTAALKGAALQRRRELAAPYLSGPDIISLRTGIGSLDLGGSPLARAAREECYRLVAARDASVQREKGSIDYLIANEDFTQDSAAVKLACSPELLGPVVRYLGALPLLFRIEMTRANASGFVPNSTHMFHLDPEDVTHLKAFVHLSDVDEGCGPFNALPADLSDEVVEYVGYREGRVEDVEVERIVGPGRSFKSVGPALTTTFCDTCRCFHFGGRPAAPDRPKRDLLVINYVLPTCFYLPRFPGDGEMPPMMRHLEPTGEEAWDALIGAIHI